MVVQSLTIQLIAKSRQTMPFQLILAQPRHLNQTAVLNNAAMITQELLVTGMAGHAIVTLLERNQSILRSRQTMSSQLTLAQPKHLTLLIVSDHLVANLPTILNCVVVICLEIAVT